MKECERLQRGICGGMDTELGLECRNGVFFFVFLMKIL
jgi:hypothetical protein